jgi:peptidyl-prolyl cis-trans isomerase SurA
MRLLKHALVLAVLTPLAALARPAHAEVVERVVAVVGERPILFSELRHRALPSLLRIAAAGQGPSFVAAAESEAYKLILGRIIDDRLEERAAERARITVSPDEVDRGIENVATTNKITVRELLVEVNRQGLTELDFREEIRRQILEGKLVELRVRARVHVTEADARESYERWRQELAKQVDHPVPPPFEDVKGDMMSRALLEGLDRQRQLFLQELRRGVYIDVRL